MNTILLLSKILLQIVVIDQTMTQTITPQWYNQENGRMLKGSGQSDIPDQNCDGTSCKISFTQDFDMFIREEWGQSFNVKNKNGLELNLNVMIKNLSYNLQLDYLYTSVKATKFGRWGTQYEQAYKDCCNKEVTENLVSVNGQTLKDFVSIKTRLRTNEAYCQKKLIQEYDYWQHVGCPRWEECAGVTGYDDVYECEEMQIAFDLQRGMAVYYVNKDVSFSAIVQTTYNDKILTAFIDSSMEDVAEIDIGDGLSLEISGFGSLVADIKNFVILDIVKKDETTYLVNDILTADTVPQLGSPASTGLGEFQIVNIDGTSNNLIYDKSTVYDFDLAYDANGHTATSTIKMNKLKSVKSASLRSDGYLTYPFVYGTRLNDNTAFYDIMYNRPFSIRRNYNTVPFKIGTDTHTNGLAYRDFGIKNNTNLRLSSKCYLTFTSPSDKYLDVIKTNYYKANDTLYSYQFIPPESVQLNNGIPDWRTISFKNLMKVKTQAKLKGTDVVIVFNDKQHTVSELKEIKSEIITNAAGSYVEFEFNYLGASGQVMLSSKNMLLGAQSIFVESTGKTRDIVGIRSVIDTTKAYDFCADDNCINLSPSYVGPPDGGSDEDDTNNPVYDQDKFTDFIKYMYTGIITAILCTVIFLLDFILSVITIITVGSTIVYIIKILTLKISKYTVVILSLGYVRPTWAQIEQICSDISSDMHRIANVKCIHEENIAFFSQDQFVQAYGSMNQEIEEDFYRVDLTYKMITYEPDLYIIENSTCVYPHAKQPLVTDIFIRDFALHESSEEFTTSVVKYKGETKDLFNLINSLLDVGTCEPEIAVGLLEEGLSCVQRELNITADTDYVYGQSVTVSLGCWDHVGPMYTIFLKKPLGLNVLYEIIDWESVLMPSLGGTYTLLMMSIMRKDTTIGPEDLLDNLIRSLSFQGDMNRHISCTDAKKDKFMTRDKCLAVFTCMGNCTASINPNKVKLAQQFKGKYRLTFNTLSDKGIEKRSTRLMNNIMKYNDQYKPEMLNSIIKLNKESKDKVFLTPNIYMKKDIMSSKAFRGSMELRHMMNLNEDQHVERVMKLNSMYKMGKHKIISTLLSEKEYHYTYAHGNEYESTLDGPLKMKCLSSSSSVVCKSAKNIISIKKSTDNFLSPNTEVINGGSKNYLFSISEAEVSVMPNNKYCTGDIQWTKDNLFYCSDDCCLMSDNQFDDFYIYEPSDSIKLDIGRGQSRDVTVFVSPNTGLKRATIKGIRGCSRCKFNCMMSCARDEMTISYWCFFLSPLMFLVFMLLMTIISMVSKKRVNSDFKGTYLYSKRLILDPVNNIKSGNLKLWQGGKHKEAYNKHKSGVLEKRQIKDSEAEKMYYPTLKRLLKENKTSMLEYLSKSDMKERAKVATEKAKYMAKITGLTYVDKGNDAIKGIKKISKINKD